MTGDREKLISLIQQANQSQQKGMTQQAANILKAALALSPHDYDIMLQLGSIYYSLGQPEDAILYFNGALKIKPTDIRLLSTVGFLYAQTGRHAEALENYARALSIDRNFIEAIYRSGKSLSAMGQHQQALVYFDRALALNPKDVLALFNRGLTLRPLGREDDALRSFDAALAIKPDFVEALFHRAILLRLTGRLEDALVSLTRARVHAPNSAELLNEQGILLQHLGRFDEALATFDRAIALQANYADALNNRAETLRAMNRLDEALAGYNQALAIRPDHVDTLINRGAALRQLEQYDAALADCDRAIALRPQLADAFNNRGNILQDLGRRQEALASYDQAIARAPGHLAALNNRGAVLRLLGRTDEALASYERALQIDPDDADSHCNLGILLAELGRNEAAVQALERAVRAAPAKASYYFNLAEAKRMTAADPHIAAMEALLASVPYLSVGDQIDLHFALGKAYADIGEPARSFHHLLSGNQMARARLSYDETDTLGGLGRMSAIFTAARLATGAHADDFAAPSGPAVSPIFIIGMPRSGTTLVEQILASHPDVHAAGETTHLPEAIAAVGLDPGPGARAVNSLADISADQLRHLAEIYITKIRERAPSQKRFIVDKMPDNFRLAGVINLAFPNARIIHVRRDPLDTCLSCFSKKFSKHLPYAFDMAELGRYYRGYDALMAHWRAVIRPDTMIEVDYQRLVLDLESQARRILLHCGLAWAPQCLDFHQTERHIRTASATQVRQPLHASAIGRWKAYEPFLGPLAAALSGETPRPR